MAEARREGGRCRVATHRVQHRPTHRELPTPPQTHRLTSNVRRLQRGWQVCVLPGTSAAVLLYCCTAVLLYCCTAVLLYCCTAVRIRHTLSSLRSRHRILCTRFTTPYLYWQRMRATLASLATCFPRCVHDGTHLSQSFIACMPYWMPTDACNCPTGCLLTHVRLPCIR